MNMNKIGTVGSVTVHVDGWVERHDETYVKVFKKYF